MKSSKRHLYLLVALLFFSGLVIFCYRHFLLDVPLTDSETVNSWVIEANLKFQIKSPIPIKATFIIPWMPPGFAILDEYFISPNYGISTHLEENNRAIDWSIRRAIGPQSLYYRAIVRETTNTDIPIPKPTIIRPAAIDETQKAAVDAIISKVRQSSADVQTFAQGTLQTLIQQDENAKLLTANSAQNFEDKLLHAAMIVLNQAKIPALSAKGFYLGRTKHAELRPLLFVYNGKKWLPINLKTSQIGIPKHFLIWQYGNAPLYHVDAAKITAFKLTVTPAALNALSIVKTRGLKMNSELLRFSLLQLPVKVQETYKILLTLPIGAFVILLLRNFIGLKTFGTFMPILIALAFRETHIIWGTVLFVMIVSLGLLARFYLDGLRLLLVPRLSAILTIVIMLMIFISIMCQNLGLESGLSVALFPMVILTMTIERMCITWDERGATEALQSGLGSLLAAITAYSVMNFPSLDYLLFAFPELLFVLLAMILLFGQYRGYRLSELFRFKALIRL